MGDKVSITGVYLVDSAVDGEMQRGARVVFREESFLIKAASLSLKDAGIENIDMEQTAIILGVDNVIDGWKKGFFKEVLSEGPIGASPLVFPYTSSNALAARATIALGIKGEDITITSGPLSFMKAVSYSFELVSSGIIKGAVVGGVTKGKALTMFMGGKKGKYFISRALESRNGEEINESKTVNSMEETFSIFIDASKRIFCGNPENFASIEANDQWGNMERFYIGTS